MKLLNHLFRHKQHAQSGSAIIYAVAAVATLTTAGYFFSDSLSKNQQSSKKLQEAGFARVKASIVQRSLGCVETFNTSNGLPDLDSCNGQYIKLKDRNDQLLLDNSTEGQKFLADDGFRDPNWYRAKCENHGVTLEYKPSRDSSRWQKKFIQGVDMCPGYFLPDGMGCNTGLIGSAVNGTIATCVKPEVSCPPGEYLSGASVTPEALSAKDQWPEFMIDPTIGIDMESLSPSQRQILERKRARHLALKEALENPLRPRCAPPQGPPPPNCPVGSRPIGVKADGTFDCVAMNGPCLAEVTTEPVSNKPLNWPSTAMLQTVNLQCPDLATSQVSRSCLNTAGVPTWSPVSGDCTPAAVAPPPPAKCAQSQTVEPVSGRNLIWPETATSATASLQCPLIPSKQLTRACTGVMSGGVLSAVWQPVQGNCTPPGPPPASQVVLYCQENASSIKRLTQTISFPQSGQCAWNSGGNGPAEDKSVIQGRRQQDVAFNAAYNPSKSVLCNLSITSNSSNFWYDDETAILLNNRVLVSTHGHIVSGTGSKPGFRKSNGIPIWDWTIMKGRHSNHGGGIFCIGGRQSTCQFPATEQTGRINVMIGSSAIGGLATELLTVGTRLTFSSVTFGDGDSDDCKRNAFSMNVVIDYIPLP